LERKFGRAETFKKGSLCDENKGDFFRETLLHRRQGGKWTGKYAFVDAQ